jgi:hypothetical protein
MLSPASTTIQQLAEHFNARTRGLCRVADADDFDFVANVDHAAFNAAPSQQLPRPEIENTSLDRHQERLVNSALRRRDESINGFHSARIDDSPISGIVPFIACSAEPGSLECRRRCSRTLTTGADFHSSQLKQLVVDLIDLVCMNDHLGNADLASEAGCAHGSGASGRQPRSQPIAHAVHLGGTGDHVLDVVGVAGQSTWAIDASVSHISIGPWDRSRAFSLARHQSRSYALKSPKYLVIAAVSVVLPVVQRDQSCRCLRAVCITFKLCLSHDGLTRYALCGAKSCHHKNKVYAARARHGIYANFS